MSDRLQINAVARPRPTPAPKMQAPAAPGTIVLKDKGKYVLLNGEVVTMMAKHGEFLSNQGWYYRVDGKFNGEHNNPLYKRHVAKEWDGKTILAHDEAREFWLGGGTVFYRTRPELLAPGWVSNPWFTFPPPTATINATFFDGYKGQFEWSKKA